MYYNPATVPDTHPTPLPPNNNNNNNQPAPAQAQLPIQIQAQLPPLPAVPIQIPILPQVDVVAPPVLNVPPQPIPAVLPLPAAQPYVPMPVPIPPVVPPQVPVPPMQIQLPAGVQDQNTMLRLLAGLVHNQMQTAATQGISLSSFKGKFRGGSPRENITLWLKKYETFTDNKNWTEQMKMDNIHLYLEDDAAASKFSRH